MQSDRELLELAAKAAGADYEVSVHGVELLTPIGGVSGDWDPINDDGDALRLAVKLGMEVYVDNHPRGCDCTEAQSHTHSTPDNAMRSCVNHDSDPYAATRRAIVIAAAEIGKRDSKEGAA